MTKTRWCLAICVAAAALAATSPLVAQQTTELPSEIREWLERDQLQRWAAMVAEGDSIFNSESCVRCHGAGGTGGRNGPDLTDDVWVQSDGSIDEIRRTILWGVRREALSDPAWRFEMNPAGGLHLEWEQYSSLAAYVWSLGNGTFLPGR